MRIEALCTGDELLTGVTVDTNSNWFQQRLLEHGCQVSRTTIVQNAWERGQELVVHGWIYGLKDGLLRDLGLSLDNGAGLTAAYASALEQLE